MKRRKYVLGYAYEVSAHSKACKEASTKTY